MTTDPVYRRLFELAEQFHGHVGPFLVAGIRMARLATALLGEIDHIQTETGLDPPVSCITDGMQIATSLTLCNKGIILAAVSGTPAAVFTGTNGHSVRLEVRPSALELMQRSSEEGLRRLAEQVASLPASELFVMTENAS